MFRVFIAAASALLCIPSLSAAGSVPHGVYRSEGALVGIGSFPELGSGSYLIDYRSGRTGRLVETSKGTHCLTATLRSPAISSDCLTLQRESFEFERRPFAAVRLATTNLTIKSSGGALACDLRRPVQGRPKFIVLLIYGSGPATISAFDPWANFFLGLGYGVLACDKRGLGGSAGDWRQQNLADLAKDARAAIADARALSPDAKIAVWGISQAGWIIPQLLASGDADLAIMHAGSLHTPAQQTMDYVGAELRAYGFEGRELEDALSYYRLDLDVTMGRRPWPEVERAFQKHKADGREWLLGPPSPADAPERRFLARIADFDPAPYWKETSRPVLAIYGEKDRVVPPDLTSAERALLESTHARSRVAILPSMNHVGLNAVRGTGDEISSLTHFAPSYWEMMSEFLSSMDRDKNAR